MEGEVTIVMGYIFRFAKRFDLEPGIRNQDNSQTQHTETLFPEHRTLISPIKFIVKKTSILPTGYSCCLYLS